MNHVFRQKTDWLDRSSVCKIGQETQSWPHISFKAATILRLLGNETIHFNTRGKKSEPDLRKQLNIEVKSTTKFKFFSLNILIYLYILLL